MLDAPRNTHHVFRIATRGSALALAQANLVLAACHSAFPDQPFEIQIVKTTGDKLPEASLTGGELSKGLFTKELENALLAGEADMAVHSLKDLPTSLPAGLGLAAVLPRADVRDVLVYRHVEYIACWPDSAKPVRQDRRGFKPELSLGSLPHGATVGTGSPRRAAQALELRPDLNIVPIRGNVGTRLRKLAEKPELDALLLATAGLERLGCQFAAGEQMSGEDVPPGLAATRVSLGEMLPCVGQAAIGIETRSGDSRVESICARLNHAETLAAVTAERAFLAAMGGGCHLAVAAYAEVEGDTLRLRAVSYLGGKPRRAEARRDRNEPVALGEQLASQLLGN
jgi:hydroxymethylbilane synthase